MITIGSVKLPDMVKQTNQNYCRIYKESVKMKGTWRYERSSPVFSQLVTLGFPEIR